MTDHRTDAIATGTGLMGCISCVYGWLGAHQSDAAMLSTWLGLLLIIVGLGVWGYKFLAFAFGWNVRIPEPPEKP